MIEGSEDKEDILKGIDEIKNFYLQNFVYNDMMIEDMNIAIDKVKKARGCQDRYEMDNSKINKLCQEHGFRKLAFVNDLLFLESKFDSWKLDIHNEINIITLYHKNRNYSKKDYHIQRKFEGNLATFENIFNFIQKHDYYVVNYKYNSKRMEKLFSLI